MKNLKIQTLVNIFLVIATVVLVFVLLPYGINTCDEPYLIIETQKQLYSPLTPLSYVVSKFIASFFGYKWIAYRGLSVTIFVLAIIISCLYNYCRKKNMNKALFLCWTMLLVYALQKDNWNSLYGYDSYSMLLTTIFAIISLSYIYRPRYRTLVVLGVISGANTLFRFPNLMCIPLAFALIVARNLLDENKSLKRTVGQASAYIVSVLATCILLCILLFGSVDTYIYRLTHMQVKGHGADIITGYVYHLFINVIPYISYLSSINLLYLLIDRQKKHSFKTVRLLHIILIILAVIEFLALWRLRYLSKSLFIVSACMTMMIYAIYHNNGGSRHYLALIFLFCCGFITTLGSNGGLVKYMVFSMVPLIAIYVTEFTRAYKLTTTTVYISILIISIAAIMRGTFDDKGMASLNSRIKHQYTVGLLTSETQADVCNQAISDFGQYVHRDDVETTVIGKDRCKYIYDYLFDSQNKHLQSVWDDADYYNDPSVVNSVETDINQVQKPYYVLYLKTDSDNKMISMLDRISIREKETNTYIIFSHVPPSQPNKNAY